MAELPHGTVTFLFTDIEGSTAQWERDRQAMATTVARHFALLEAAITSHHGVLFKTVGDAVQAAFPTAPSAVGAAIDAQRALHAEVWKGTAPLRVRMALHAGEAEPDDVGDYLAAPLNRLARLLASGHGGQILLSQAVQQLSRGGLPEGVALRDLGEHRLRDLLEPERIWQVVVPGLPSEFPSLRSLDWHATNLPFQLTSLVGRDADIAIIQDLFRREGSRFVTLAGPGGTGKTRLAVAVAAELLDAFPDGIWFVDLAPLDQPALVLPAIASALGVRAVEERLLPETLAAFVAPKRLLLVLDNFEHVLDAVSVVSELLQAGSHVAVLVTSREPLRLSGEREIAVGPLPLPDIDTVADLEVLAQSPAVDLFVQRAQAVKADFTLTNDNAVAIATICQRLDGLPLAIELAAARVKVLPPPALLARLERNLPVLTGGARDAPQRHRTLHGAITWSHDLLDGEEQTLFRRLGVFVGGWTFEAAEAIASPGGDRDVFTGLASLIDKNLVRQEQEPGGEPRFRMLETIREYAHERLVDSSEEGEIRARHAAYFATLAELAELGFPGPEEGAWLDRCAVEFGNVRAALAWAEAGGAAAVGMQLGAALRWFWVTRGGLAEGRGWLERLLNRGADAPADVRAKALLTFGALAILQSDYPTSTRALQESLTLYQASTDAFGTARAMCFLGVLDHEQGEAQRAEARLTEALDAFRALGSTVWEAIALFWLGTAALFGTGDLDRARTLLKEAVVLNRKVGYGSGVAMALANLGAVALAQGDPERAERVGREALALGWERGDRFRMAEQLEELAIAAAAQGHGERAARLGGAAEVIGGSIGLDVARSYGAKHESFVSTVQALLGADRMAETWQAGRALPLEHAIAEALGTGPLRVRCVRRASGAGRGRGAG